MDDRGIGGAEPRRTERRLASAFEAELEAARRDVAARPLLGLPSARARDRNLRVVFVAAVMVLFSVGVALVRTPATVRPPASVAPAEPTREHVEAARWVTGNLKYLYQLALYPPDATAPSPDFLFTKPGLAEAVAQDDLLRRAVARQISVGLNYDLRSICVVSASPVAADLDITLEITGSISIFDASRSHQLGTLAPGPRHLRVAIVHDVATGHWLIDHWQGSPFDTVGNAAPSGAAAAFLGCG
jgi:hypothetical protein